MAGQKARLWNRSQAHFHAVIEEKTYDIAAGKFQVMSLDEAVAVQGHYPGKGVSWPVEVERIGGEETLSLFKCPRDGQTFGSQAELDKHLATHTDQVKREENDKPADKVWACVDCEREFPSKQQLKLHMRSHKETKAATVDTSTSVSDGN